MHARIRAPAVARPPTRNAESQNALGFVSVQFRAHSLFSLSSLSLARVRAAGVVIRPPRYLTCVYKRSPCEHPREYACWNACEKACSNTRECMREYVPLQWRGRPRGMRDCKTRLVSFPFNPVLTPSSLSSLSLARVRAAGVVIRPPRYLTCVCKGLHAN